MNSDALGRLDLVAGKGVRASVEAATGRPFTLAHRAGDRLHARTGLEAEVRVTPRRGPLDVYA